MGKLCEVLVDLLGPVQYWREGLVITAASVGPAVASLGWRDKIFWLFFQVVSVSWGRDRTSSRGRESS